MTSDVGEEAVALLGGCPALRRACVGCSDSLQTVPRPPPAGHGARQEVKGPVVARQVTGSVQRPGQPRGGAPT